MDRVSSDPLRALITRWREDAGSTYCTWFLWEERIKNFRSIRRGLAVVVQEIEAGTFRSAYRGSSLETVVGSIAEQRLIFKGADHAFLWKPKLRIPDIYENPENQRAFGRFLKSCACCDTEDAVVAAIRQLDAQRIKGRALAPRPPTCSISFIPPWCRRSTRRSSAATTRWPARA